MHQGRVSADLGIAGLPAEREEQIVRRDLELVRQTKCRYHVQHVSTAGTVELVRIAKREGLPVTAEVAPHHLAFDDECVRTGDTVFKMYPPLRSADDVAAVRQGLAEGVIDAVATDHAPHTTEEKHTTFVDAPRGVIGLETAASVVHSIVGLSPGAFFDRMSTAPRRIMGRKAAGFEPGVPADLVVFDPDSSWTVTHFRSKASNSPWHGKELRGRVTLTMAGGSIVHDLEGAST